MAIRIRTRALALCLSALVAVALTTGVATAQAPKTDTAPAAPAAAPPAAAPAVPAAPAPPAVPAAPALPAAAVPAALAVPAAAPAAPATADAKTKAAAAAKVKPSPEQAKQAKKDLSDGNKLVKGKNFEEALPKLEAAYGVDAKAGTLKSIAQCQRETKRLAAAHTTYEKLRAVHSKQLSKKDKADIDKALAELKEQTGTVKIAVAQAGAALKLDQKDLPADQLGQPIRLDVGKHKLAAMMTGFEPFESDVEVAGGKEAAVEVRLQPEIKTGHVRVTEPTGKPVHVLVDGKDVGPTPWEGDLEPGQHTVALVGDKLASEVKTIDIVVKSTAELAIPAIAVAPPPTPKAKFAFTTTPPTAQLTINGQPMPALAGELEPGMYQFVISAPGYQPVTRQVTVTAAQPFTENIVLSLSEPEVPTVRVGALVGLIALPRPLEAELLVKFKDTVGLGAQYSMVPTITFPGKDSKIEMWAIQGIVRWFPWSGSFYLGAGFGSQTFKASMSSTSTQTLGIVTSSGTLETTADASTLFVSPQLGWLWTWGSGLTLGLNAGVQIPLSSPPGATTTFNGVPVVASCAGIPAALCDQNLANTAASNADSLGSVTNIIAKIPLPNIDLLKIGFFF
jgi:hypothetical protein